LTKLQAAEINPYGAPIMVVIVDSALTVSPAGDQLLKRIQPYFPTHPIMLASIEQNGYRAHAPFQTHRLLALIQLEQLRFREIDLSIPPPDNDEPLPF
jgi:hypothetical protein